MKCPALINNPTVCDRTRLHNEPFTAELLSKSTTTTDGSQCEMYTLESTCKSISLAHKWQCSSSSNENERDRENEWVSVRVSDWLSEGVCVCVCVSVCMFLHTRNLVMSRRFVIIKKNVCVLWPIKCFQMNNQQQRRQRRQYRRWTAVALIGDRQKGTEHGAKN